jgi:PKD repeat protein
MVHARAKVILSVLLVSALLAGPCSAFVVMAGSGEIAAVGQTRTIEIKIDNLNASLWYYNITVALEDPDIGEIVNLHFPSWIQLATNSIYPADTVIIKGGALFNQPQAGAINTPLGSIEIRGDKPGETGILLTVNSMQTQYGEEIVPSAAVMDGSIKVASPNGSIDVRSIPDGAKIYIDNIDSGSQTNTTINGVLPGTRTVKVTKNGYRPAELPVTVIADQTVNADFVLEQLTGSIHVTSVPPDAEIFIDDADTGKQTNTTIDNVLPGLHTVKVTKDDYKPAELPITVVADQTVNADFILEQLTGAIHVTSVPNGAEIFIDNADTGSQTNTTIDNLLPGLHTVKVTKDDYKPAELPVTVIADQTVDADFILEQLTGSIHVTSVPDGAKISLDGASTGLATNTTIDNVLPGPHTVKVTKDGYKPAEMPVTVEAYKTVDADITLEQLTGSIHVTSVPPDARIFIDDADTGKQTNSTVSGITPGLHTVKVTLSGYHDAQKTVTVIADQTVNADFILEQLTGSIHVTSVPDGANISLDGASTGLATNTTIDNILPGPHTVKVTKDDYKPAELPITVIADQTVNADFILEQLTGSIQVTSVPPDARIFIDNVDTRQQTNTTIDNVLPGLHTVKVTKDDYKPAELPITVVADQTVDADFILEQLTGSIDVTSVPDGAKIYLDNVDSGKKTNNTVGGILLGTRTVKVTKDGYKPAEMPVTVEADQTVNADFILEQLLATGSIRVTSVPSGAEIFVDNVDTGKQTNSTIGGIIPGDHKVKVSLARYREAEKTVTVATGATAPADFILERLPGLPRAQFLAFPRQGTAPLTVLFVDLSQGSPASRVWDFGDGSTSTERFPLHTYKSAGRYTVKLTVSNSAGSDTLTRENYITVNPENPPKAQFVAYPRQGKAPLSVLFLDLSRGNPSSRVWDFGDGSTSTDRFPVHTYENSGKYTVRLSVSNSGGSDTLTREDYIIVMASRPPNAQFTASPHEGTAPLTVTFRDVSRGSPTSRLWDFGDGFTSTEPAPVHTYTAAGKYTVTLTVANDAGSDTAVMKEFISVTTKKQRITGTEDSKEKAGESENKSQNSGSEERPKIKFT